MTGSHRIISRVAAAVVGVLVAVTGSGCSELVGALGGHELRVTGYAESGSTTTAQMKASSEAMTMVGVDGVNLLPAANRFGPVDKQAYALLKTAHRQGQTAELLIGNYDQTIEDFNSKTASKMLSSKSNTVAVVEQLRLEVQAHKWDGVTVDLEAMGPSDIDGLTRFVRLLKTAVGANKSVSIALTADPLDYRKWGYDTAAIGAAVDHVALMAYDQHGPSWTDAGPVGGLPWVRGSLDLLLKTVPAAKVQLGIAGYGYSWKNGKLGDYVQYSDADARAFVKKHGAQPSWNATEGEWTATTSDGTVIWWSDARSYKLRKQLAKSKGLEGVAVWSLSLSDPLS